ncbi:MAG: hypothetical protein ABJE47_23325 [bacterium]
MKAIDRARRVVGAAYVRLFADAETMELILGLERESARLRAELAWRRRAESTHTGRYVAGRTAAWSILIGAIFLATYWLGATDDGIAARRQFMAGMADGHAAALSTEGQP